MMKPTFLLVSLAAAVFAAPDPLITPRAELVARQNDPARLGWVDATNGQFSDIRYCDSPATLSSSGALAQCCAGTKCTFWQSCSAGTLFAGTASSLRCDQGFCNTAVIVPTVGASSGVNYLGCWATSLGESAFTIIKDIGSAQTAAPSSGVRSSAANSAASRVSSVGDEASMTHSHSATAAASSGAAAGGAVKPVTGVLGLVALVFGLL